MSVAQETPVKAAPAKPAAPAPNGRWAGYRHLLMARMLELKREPEVVFWVFVFPLLLALGLGIAFRNKPGDAVSVAIVSGAESQRAQDLLGKSPHHDLFKVQVLDSEDAQKVFAWASSTSSSKPTAREASLTGTIRHAPRACWPRPRLTPRCKLPQVEETRWPRPQLRRQSRDRATSTSSSPDSWE